MHIRVPVWHVEHISLQYKWITRAALLRGFSIGSTLDSKKSDIYIQINKCVLMI